MTETKDDEDFPAASDSSEGQPEDRFCFGRVCESILGGISEAQWTAFTIEEQFSLQRLPTPTADSLTATESSPSVDLPESQPLAVTMSGDEKNRGQASSHPEELNVEQTLDRDLVRIFLKYESSASGLINMEQFDACSKLIGVRLDNIQNNGGIGGGNSRLHGKHGKSYPSGKERVEDNGFVKRVDGSENNHRRRPIKRSNSDVSGKRPIDGMNEAINEHNNNKQWALLNSFMCLSLGSVPLFTHHSTNSAKPGKPRRFASPPPRFLAQKAGSINHGARVYKTKPIRGEYSIFD